MRYTLYASVSVVLALVGGALGYWQQWSQAVQSGQGTQYVYVVKPDLSVEYRPVSVGMSQNGESVIEKGLRPGERVVTDGQLRLAPGFKVAVKQEEAT